MIRAMSAISVSARESGQSATGPKEAIRCRRSKLLLLAERSRLVKMSELQPSELMPRLRGALTVMVDQMAGALALSEITGGSCPRGRVR